MRRPVIGLLALAACLCGEQEQNLSLADAEAAALRNHPAIASSRSLVDAANAVTQQTRSAFYPSLTGNVTGVGAERDTAIAAGNVTTSALANRFASGFALNQMIFDFGRTSRRVESDTLRAGSQGQTASFVRSQVLLRVRQAYFRALAARSVLRVAQDTIGARKLTLKQVSALARSNLKSSLDVSFADVNVSEAELALFRAENDLKTAYAELGAAMGDTDLTTYRLLEEPMPKPLPDSAASLIATALQHRADVSGLRLTQNSVESLAQSERRLWLPTVSLIGAAGVLPQHEDRIKNRYSGVGVNLTIPLLSGGLFSGRRAEAEARATAARHDVRELEVRVARDVKLAYLNAENAHKRLGVTTRLLEQSSTSLRLAQARYDLGLSSIIELTQAQLNKTAAEIAEAGARYEYQAARSALDFEIGALQ